MVNGRLVFAGRLLFGLPAIVGETADESHRTKYPTMKHLLALLPVLLLAWLATAAMSDRPIIASEPAPAGFVPLFDGQTWTNWDHPAHLDGVWEIADGVIRLRTDEPPREKNKDYNLSTTRKFRDFTLLLDWRLTGTPHVKPHQWLTDDGQFHTDAAGKTLMKDHLTWGDSGVYLRGVRAAQVNIWCQPCGSGEVGTKFKDTQTTKEERLKTMPSVRADKGPGEWNRFVITLRGDRVDISLNGVQVITGARVKEIPAEGPITLQNHKDAVDFRNIFIKELNVSADPAAKPIKGMK